MTQPRIGFACKLIDSLDQINGIKPTDNCKKYNVSGTTVSWLKRQTTKDAEEKLWALMVGNINAILALVTKVSTFEPHLRMVRLGSDILPAYTHSDWTYFWTKTSVRDYAAQEFSKIGQVARAHNVKLSFHPGQYTCIVSENPGIVERSIAELEYHADMARWMGYGVSKLDFKINVHLSGKLGVSGFDAAFSKMSPVLKSCLTLENDEYQVGIDELLTLSDRVGIVLDIHHHYIHTGEYFENNDPRIEKIVNSWHGCRPTIHYSASREDVLGSHPINVRPDLKLLIASGHKKAKLRAHSDTYWNTALNEWALTHLSWADICCEVKSKNLGSAALASLGKKLNIV